MKKIGFTWLEEKLEIKGFQLTHKSYIGTTDNTELGKSSIERIFNPKYDINTDNPLLHLEFALKYDDLNLAFVKEVFNSIDHQIILDYVTTNPNRKYQRIIGYLYEFLTENTIRVKITTTNYEDILDISKYSVGENKKNAKWKINDNLLGTEKFCPIIRKTTELTELVEWDIKAELQNLENQYSPTIFRRASYYLYKKETKSSIEIEKEEPSKDRMDKFITLLEEAGQKSFEETVSEKELVRLQNVIVDARYADTKFRNNQNYVGENVRDGSQKIHYVCPPPQFVKSLMQGITSLNEKISSINSILKATLVSFGYVYIHPFEDGNGRIHRFLIHDILVRDGIVPNGTIVPVSAQILANMDKYDIVLETFSKLVNKKVKYTINDNGEMTLKNPSEIEALYRFPDLTNHAVFLATIIKNTVTKDVPEELYFLQCYDELKKSIQNIVDMPNNKIDRMILFLHQNNGKLASRKRKLYQELEEEEIQQMEQAYSQIFEKK